MSDQFQFSRFLETFVAEARERLGRLERGLLRLEREAATPELLNEMLREAHTLKGSARMIGLMKLDALAHHTEEVLGALRDSAEPASPGVISVLLEAADALKALIEEAAGGPPAPDAADLMARMTRWGGQAIAPGLRGAEGAGADECSLPREPRAQSRARRAAASESTVRVEVAKLEKLSNLSLDLVAACEQLRRADRRLAHAAGEVQRLRRAVADLALRLEAADKAPPAVGAVARRVAALTEQQRALADEVAQLRQAFQTDSHRTVLVIDELRELATDLHMLPIATVFDAFPRAVRDLAVEHDKEVQFIIAGGEVKLDKKITEEIGEPLLHLLRNAVVHGIEAPQERERGGKPRRGTVRLTAATHANHILITVQDDGAGMDVAALKAKAVERGVIDKAAAQTLTHQQALELAFVPGLSTTRMITDLSGRGVGMDVVRAVARRLNGSVTILSQPGTGCAVTLELPLTLAIMHVLLLRAGGCDMAMPSAFVRAILKCESDNGELPRTCSVDDEPLPVVSLAGLMEREGGGNGAGRQRSLDNGRRIVAIQAVGERLGLVADEVLDEREVILRPLGPHFAAQRKVMAATLLAEGIIAPVLDVAGLVEASRTYQSPPPAPTAPKPRPAVLLVEDSAITADLERFILEQAGYQVAIAGDGLEALALLGKQPFDLVVADLEMPRMDGFALLERVRASAEYTKLPVVIVTSRQSLEDKRRGLDLGANAYITKGTFDQNALLDTIARLIG